MSRFYLYIIVIFGFSCNTDKTPEEVLAKERISVFMKNQFDSQLDRGISLDPDIGLHSIQIAAYGLLGKTTLNRAQDEAVILIADASEQLQFIAGSYTLYASKNGSIIDKAFFKLHPKSIKGKSTNYVGPKTTSYNDRLGSMITGYFEDQHQNLVDTVFTLNYHIQTQTDKRLVQVNTEHNYYFKHTIPSKNDTKQLVGISSGNEYSKELTVIGSSGCPKNASIEVSDRYNVADSHQIFIVDLDDIIDDDGHIVSDGTHLMLTLHSEEVTSQYSGVVVNGGSKIIVQNPSFAGSYKITISSCGAIISKMDNLIFNPLISEIPYIIKDKQLMIGPLLSQLNQTIPDGTVVSISSNQCPDMSPAVSQTKNGISTLDIEDVLENCIATKFTIKINGVESELLLTKPNSNDS